MLFIVAARQSQYAKASRVICKFCSSLNCANYQMSCHQALNHVVYAGVDLLNDSDLATAWFTLDEGCCEGGRVC